MAINITVPDLGDGLDSGDVLTVLVAEGDVVQVEQGIVELETDKAVAEVPATHAGRVSAIHVEAGQTVAVGAPLISVEPAEASAPAEPAAPLADATEAPTAQPTAPQPAAQQPATTPPPATPAPVTPAPATPAPVTPAPVTPAPVTPAPVTPAPATPAAATPAAAAPAPTTPAPTTPAPTTPAPTTPAPTTPAPATGAPTVDATGGLSAPAGPAVRRYARELGVDLAMVRGSGPEGRITKSDVRRAVRQATQTAIISAVQTADAPVAAPPVTPPDAVAPPGEAASDDWGPISIDRVSKIRSTIAANMVRAKSTAPHVTNFDDADVTELEQIRQSSKVDYANAGVKLTTMPFVIKAVAQSLQKHPIINASLDLEAGQILYKQYVNIGVAVDTQRGLMVPVIRQADVLGIPQIARALSDIADKARNNKITIDEMRGGTFTISNLGAIGGTYSTPVINVPEVAILLIGRSREMPIVVDGEIEVRLMMPLSLSYDHRLVDGAAAARFLNEVKGYLQAPGRLLLAP